jgi:hypothetical protein
VYPEDVNFLEFSNIFCIHDGDGRKIVTFWGSEPFVIYKLMSPRNLDHYLGFVSDSFVAESIRNGIVYRRMLDTLQDARLCVQFWPNNIQLNEEENEL